MTRTRVSETTYEDRNGDERTQYRTTIPKGLAEALELGGREVRWTVETGNALRLTRVDDDE